MLEQSIDTKTVEWKGDRHGMEFPEGVGESRSADSHFSANAVVERPIPDGQRFFPFGPDLKAVQ